MTVQIYRFSPKLHRNPFQSYNTYGVLWSFAANPPTCFPPPFCPAGFPSPLGLLYHPTTSHTLLPTPIPAHLPFEVIRSSGSWGRKGHVAQSRRRNPAGFASLTILCSPRINSAGIKLALLSPGQQSMVRRAKPASSP